MSDLIAEMRLIVGDQYVITEPADAEVYGHDVTGNYPGKARAVVRPGTTEEVSRVLAAAHAAGVAVVPQSGNTGVTGGSYTGTDGDRILLSLGRMNRIEAIDTTARTATVGAGVILQNLHAAVEEKGLVFPLFFGARGSCMIGGNLSTNAGGSNVLRYGNTRSLTLGIEVVLADGRVMNLMSALHKDNTGYDLKDLFIGAEGTLGVITRAIVKLFPRPRAYATALLAMDDLSPALDLLHRLQDRTGGAVEAFEFMPEHHGATYLALDQDRRWPLPAPAPVNILLEVGATSDLLAGPGSDGRPHVQGLVEEVLAEEIEAGHVKDAAIAQNESQRAGLWHIRECAFEIAISDGPAIDFDVALPLGGVAPFLAGMGKTLDRVSPGAVEHIVCHLGDGNIHYSVVPEGNRDGIPEALRTAVTEAVEDQVNALGGSFSAEHGIGLSKLASMRRQKDTVALDMMRSIKQALDPKGIMNPGKVIP